MIFNTVKCQSSWPFFKRASTTSLEVVATEGAEPYGSGLL